MPWKHLGLYIFTLGFPGGSNGKESAGNAGDLGLIPVVGISPQEWHGKPLQYSCLENSHGQKSLAGYTPWVHKESDTTERLSMLLLLSHFSHVRLCDPRDRSPPGSPVPGILQARTLEWVVISFSNEWKWKVKVKLLSRIRPSGTPMDCSLPGSSVHGIFQARVLE